MKRPLLIIIGIILVLLLVAVWVYILFFKTPTADSPTFADLTFGDTTDSTYTPSDNNTAGEQPLVDVTGTERLRQLTTRPVIGYQDIRKSASSTPRVYYVESGVGHIFSINLTTGEEKRVSGTTIPSAQRAAITPNGRFIMLQSGSGNNAEFVVGEISSTSESIDIDIIGEQIITFTDTSDSTFLYAIKTTDSVIAKEYDPVKATSKTLFTVPFREAIIVWGKNATDAHYVYPKATNQLEGYLYRVDKEVLQRLPIDGYGLSIAGAKEGILYSKQENEQYKSFTYTMTDKIVIPLALTIIPEKCVALTLQPSTVLCGGSILSEYDESMPDSWYKGLLSFSDNLWLINSANGVAEQLVAVADQSGRQVDMTDLRISNDDTRAYFVDSNNNNLWLYELTADETTQ
jgi:hypothetical protein